MSHRTLAVPILSTNQQPCVFAYAVCNLLRIWCVCVCVCVFVCVCMCVCQTYWRCHSRGGELIDPPTDEATKQWGKSPPENRREAS